MIIKCSDAMGMFLNMIRKSHLKAFKLQYPKTEVSFNAYPRGNVCIIDKAVKVGDKTITGSFTFDRTLNTLEKRCGISIHRDPNPHSWVA